MSEPELIQRQRELLRAFRQAATQRARAEAEAEACRKAEEEASSAALTKVRETGAARLASVGKAKGEAQAALARVGLQTLLEQVKASPSTAGLGADPAQELAHSISIVTESCVAIQRNTNEWWIRGLQQIGYLRSGGLLGRFSGRTVWAVAFSPDDRLLASGGEDRTVRVWDIQSGREVYTFHGHRDWVRSVAFSPDGRLLVSGSGDATIRLWDLQQGREEYVLSGHNGAVLSVAFSPDGCLLASGSRDSTVRLWEVRSFKNGFFNERTLSGPKGNKYGVGFSPNGHLLASGSGDGSVCLWRLQGDLQVHTSQVHSDLPFIDLPARAVVPVRPVPEGVKRTSLATSYTSHLPTPSELAGYSGIMPVRKEVEALKMYTLQGHEGPVYSVAFSPDGSLLVSGSDDKTVRLWDVQNGQELLTLRKHQGEVYSVAFSPDGRFVASGSYDCTVRVWEVQSGREVRVLQGHKASVESVAFSFNGRLLVSGSDDGTIRLWGLK